MIPPIVYYLVLPFAAAFAVIRFLGKYADHALPNDVARLIAERPIEKKWFRTVRRDQKGLKMLGDYERHADAVDAAYQARKEAQAAGLSAAFLVLNQKGEALEEVDS